MPFFCFNIAEENTNPVPCLNR